MAEPSSIFLLSDGVYHVEATNIKSSIYNGYLVKMGDRYIFKNSLDKAICPIDIRNRHLGDSDWGIDLSSFMLARHGIKLNISHYMCLDELYKKIALKFL